MSTKSLKVFSDLECEDEVKAESRMKRKAATTEDTKARKRNRKATEKGISSIDTTTKKRGRGRPKREGKEDGGNKSKGTSSSKQSIKRVREQRKKEAEKAKKEEAREKARKSGLALDNHAGNIIAPAEDKVDSAAAAPEDFFWEVESVIGRRVHRGRVEYLIRWKGCKEEDNTWEPTANLCDTAMEEAAKFTKALKRKEKQREEDEKRLFGEPDDSTNDKDVVVIDEPTAKKAASNPDDSMAVDSETPIVDDTLWKWSDVDQVTFRDVERIDVNDPNASKIVTEARINGTPLVLVGHVGWANFAKRWLTEKKEKKERKVSEDKGKPNKASKNEGGSNAVANPVTVDLTTNAAGIVDGNPTQPDSKIAAEKGGDVTMEVGDSNNSTVEEKVTLEEPVQEEDKKQSGTTATEGGKKVLPCNESTSNDLLDLSKNYKLDVKKMIKDIGGEDVPVIKRHYNEVKPIHGSISAEKFLTTCWPSLEPETASNEQDANTTGKNQKTSANLYLHQWQFPLSDTAGRKLCHNNNPLPQGIMGEDLLKYWLDLPQCKLDSPLQYIFMGREDTLSKLHKDPGGLEISIAPIVGEKECVLVHRDDGSNCLYHLTASLDDIDLHRHPLMSQARTWRTIIKPGEILLMPYGTYHQCCNKTPCLSYSRFHLDTVNLLPFVQSLVNGDAPEIDHEEVLWNLTSEFIKRVDGVFDKFQTRVRAGLDEGDLVTGDVVNTVNTLRTLRHFVREVARREEIRQIVKGSSEDSEKATKNSDEHNFGMLVDDVDMCLHEFRYRQSKVVPPFKARRGKALKNTISGSSGGRKDVIKRDMSKFVVGGKPVVAFNTSLENNYTSLVNADVEKHFPNHAKDKVGESLIGELVPGDMISVKLEQKHVKAEVIEILPHAKAAYLSFEDYPSVYDEYQPYELIRLPTRAEIPVDDIKPGLTVIDLSNSNEYRAKIQSTVNGPMARVKLIVSQHEMTRLVCPAMILGRYVPPKKRSKKTSSVALEVKESVPEPPVLRPTKVDQMVEVGSRETGWRGAARVIKVHGLEPNITHVDVRFILGTANEASMIPIDMVQLAPELDPNQRRGRRQLAKQGSSSEDDDKAKNDGVVSPSSLTDTSSGV